MRQLLGNRFHKSGPVILGGKIRRDAGRKREGGRKKYGLRSIPGIKLYR